MNNCGGCGEPLSVTAPVHEHPHYGLLCRKCHLFAQDCEQEVARLRLFAETLAAIEASWEPRKVVN